MSNVVSIKVFFFPWYIVAVTSTIPVTAVTPQLNPQQQSALTSLYTLSNGNGNTGGTMTTQAPTGLTNGASTGHTADLSALGLHALPTSKSVAVYFPIENCL